MNYIKQTVEQKILETSSDYSCLLLIGPRQVGKTTMLEHLMEGTKRRKVMLDDTDNRRLAKNDSTLFLELHPVSSTARNLFMPAQQKASRRRLQL